MWKTLNTKNVDIILSYLERKKTDFYTFEMRNNVVLYI